MTTLYRPVQLGLAVLAALAVLFCSAAPARGAEPGTTATPAGAAASWLATELEANDGMLAVTFGTDVFPDQGLTIDAVIALLAAGHGDDPAVDLALDALAADITDYVTGFAAPDGRAAGAIAKALLLEEISGADITAGFDLDAALRALMETSGKDPGRFSDISDFGNFANTLGQSLAVLALDRTAGGVPADATAFLLGEQCPNGSFRLYHVDPAGPDDPHVCTDNAQGDADATAFALQALLVVPSTSDVLDAIDGAVAFLLDEQQASGGFFGTGAVNSNTTGVAATALRAAGEDEAADAGAAFLAALQASTCEELGALAYDQTAFDAGIDADRGQWTRATAQGALGLGLPAYGGIGTVAPVDAGLDEISCPAAPEVPKVVASVGSVVAGGEVTLTADGFLPGEPVDITLHSTPISLGSATADADGQVVKTVTIPATLEPGVHSIELVGRTSGVTVEVDIEILGADGAPLPATGSASGELTAVAVGLLALGATLLTASRRRLGQQVH